jgi:parvulin-like peptidyl-prolyl isomerase
MPVTMEQIRARPGRGGRPVAALLRWCAVMVAACAAAVLSPRSASAAQPQIVARVNGEPLTQPEFQRMRANPMTLRQLQQELGVQEPGAKELDRLALRKLVQHRLMLQEAGLKKITVEDKEIDESIDALRHRFGGAKGLGEWMKQQGLDESSLLDSVRGDMLATRLSAALVKDVRVTDEQVQHYYDSHKEELKTSEVRLQVILVKDKKAAEEVLAALRGGKDFATVARERSAGRRAAKGGDTGWVDHETLAPGLRNVVGKMKVGQAGGPVLNGDKSLIVRLADRRLGKTKTLAEARPQIGKYLLAAKRQEVLREWLAQQEKKAKVEVLLADLKPKTKTSH